MNKKLLIVTVLITLMFLYGCGEAGRTTEGRVKLEERGKGKVEQFETSRETTKAEMFDYQHVELENGLDVITLEDFSCPIVTVQIWYHVGSKDEQPNRQGFAHMFEHMMFRGTDKLGPTDHFGLIRKVGGSSNGYTGFDRTVYLETLPAEQIELALWLEAERMAFLRIDQESFDTERKVVEEEQRLRLNEPYGTLFENLLKEVFKEHPYRWAPIGKTAHLRAAEVSELRDFWQRFYVPSNSTLVIVGAVTHEQAQTAVDKYFGWIPRYEEPPRITIREGAIKGPRFVNIKEENAPAPGVGVVYKAVPLSHQDAVVLDIAAAILGRGNSSRLYRELVAEKQLAVAVEAANYSLEQDGLFGAGAAMSPIESDANSVLEIIEKHIGGLRKEPVSRRELLKAKNQLLRDLVTQNLRIESKARMLGSAAVEMGDVSRVSRELENIRRVTAEDIVRVANEYLKPEQVLKVNVERNLLGTVLGKKEQEMPVTAEPEKQTPQYGREGVTRSDDFPQEPPIAKVSPARLMPKHSSRILDNGLKVLVVENHEVPFVSVNLGLLAGAWTEEKAGTAAMAMKMLTKGTANYTEGKLADELETYAIGISGSADMDTGMVRMSCLTEYIERALELFSEVVLSPIFPAEEFEKLRKQVLTSLAIESAKPEYLAEKEFRYRLYGKHPYSRTVTGEVEDVNVLAVDDLKKWWNKFARPDMMVLIFSGDINENRAYELAEAAFGDFGTKAPKPTKELAKLPVIDKTHIFLVDRPGSVQSQIRIGHLGITRHDEGYFTSRVVSNYFGWAFNSRLNEKIRVEKGLSYAVWGGYMAKRFAGEFKTGTFSKTESTSEAVQAVIGEIERLKSQGPKEKELEESRSYILGSFVKNRETPQQIANDLWLIESQGLEDDYLERLLDGIAETNRQDCENLVNETIESNKLVVVVVGQAEKLKEQLEKIAPVTIIEQ